MTTSRLAVIRRGLALALLCAAAGAWAQAPAAPPSEANWQARQQQMMQRRLDRLAQRLEIRASQQDAWQAFASAQRASAAARAPFPGPDADAAAIARFRAEQSNARAQRLAQIADATVKLQQALDPKQRLVLDEVARAAGHPRWHARFADRCHGSRWHDGPGEGWRGRS